MAEIYIGSEAIDRDTYASAGYTVLDLNTLAAYSGTIYTWKIWLYVSATNAKVGTFSGSGLEWDDRDYETIGSVTAGSEQTFNDLDIDVETGDGAGFYDANGQAEAGAGNAGGYKAGDQFGQGAQTYTDFDYYLSFNGTGTTGWSNIAKVNGVTATDLAKVRGIAVASIAKRRGVAV